MPGHVVLRLVLTGLGAAVSPVAVIALISLMFRTHAKRNSLLFLLGYTLALLSIGIVVVYVLHVGGSGEKSKLDAYIDLFLGILCLALMTFTLLKKKSRKQHEGEKDLRGSRAFALGILMMAPNTSTLVIFISGLHVISRSNLSVTCAVMGLILLTFFTLLTLTIPTLLYFVFPKKAGTVLASLQGWLSKHERIIGAAVLLVFGVYLVAKGLTAVF
ncbi:MAG: GAP family protein [Actinobacteria bacterium]|nr:GAP family protein [Actinomycetota bacterium]